MTTVQTYTQTAPVFKTVNTSVANKKVKFNDGNQFPIVGLGTWKAKDEDVYYSVKNALDSGYRHIDTAAAYGNEEQIGKAIKDSGIPRKELYITTKLWSNRHHDPVGAIKESLDKLQLDYVDLYLLHWPVFLNPQGTPARVPLLPNGQRDIVLDWSFVKTYSLMHDVHDLGLAKSIGVSNFSVKNMKILLAAPETKITPVVNQVELHPHLPQFALGELCAQHGIKLQAYSPLGSNGSPVLKDETLLTIAEKYGVSPATVVFSWMCRRDVIYLPKSLNKHRLASNLKSVDLSDEDVDAINRIHKTFSKRYNDQDWSPMKPFEEDE
ncbi:aldo/keto reductase [Yamadazyma tenuis]|uniref:2-dehydropantolactone reductase n=1 Tax=Candida tenuis (strain ATCC 10573 / BCRC 21748 / CBS 615 / JCM 9827 / NBRC 10315 / NRRL Y-1498 / VKM Y-70) TaxID=590646 RepID=G3B117_CANTC|nr:uncharacterized protein CANTEDRAFT_130029 [Yamadazyma tenuis ATCC 10573]EGV64858.1 hypothetical protein CANTEDRAFT_130029 [Yamadazyma tenuis ATCC 10573]WEJ97653.1 aldo/keto reductase [Yamadazyma tenuis]